MKKLCIAAAFLLLFWASALPLQAKTLFHDDFSDGDNWEDDWYQLGSPGYKVLQIDGHLEAEGSNGTANKNNMAVTKEKFDFTNGTTFEGVITVAGPDFLDFWVAQNDGKGQAEDDPWFTVNWLRVSLEGATASIYVEKAKPAGEGMPAEGHLPMEIGTPYKISIYMEIKKYKVYVDGKEIISGKHEQDFTKAHIIFSVWTTDAAVKENHKLDDVFVYEGDYDPNPPSMPVKTEGKLATTWGSIKARY